MTDEAWAFHHENGLVERDGSVYACTICGKERWCVFLNPWPFRCEDCDPNKDWFWSHYFAFEWGLTMGQRFGRNSETQ